MHFISCYSSFDICYFRSNSKAKLGHGTWNRVPSLQAVCTWSSLISCISLNIIYVIARNIYYICMYVSQDTRLRWCYTENSMKQRFNGNGLMLKALGFGVKFEIWMFWHKCLFGIRFLSKKIYIYRKYSVNDVWPLNYFVTSEYIVMEKIVTAIELHVLSRYNP